MEKVSRRSVLKKITGAFLGLGAVTAAWPYMRSIFPNVLYEPPQKFKIGLPDSFSQGVQYMEDRRIYIFREENAFHIISGVCTHLGCTVKFSPHRRIEDKTVRKMTYKSIGEFQCPCHGSKFHDEGTNYSGPAPRPLKWHPIEISPEDGQLVVDLSKEVNRDFKLVV